jgi:hypothetical protein
MQVGVTDVRRSPDGLACAVGVIVMAFGLLLDWNVRAYKGGGQPVTFGYSGAEEIGRVGVLFCLVPAFFIAFGLWKRETGLILTGRQAAWLVLGLCVLAGVSISRATTRYTGVAVTSEIGIGLYVTALGALLVILAAPRAARLARPVRLDVSERRWEVAGKVFPFMFVAMIIWALAAGIGTDGGGGGGWCDDFMVPCELP